MAFVRGAYKFQYDTSRIARDQSYFAKCVAQCFDNGKDIDFQMVSHQHMQKQPPVRKKIRHLISRNLINNHRINGHALWRKN